MIKADYHVHSHFSGDSKEKPENIIKYAMSKGLDTLCFTDHMDYEYWYEPAGMFEVDVPKYFEALLQLKEQYAGTFNVRIGIELGLRDEPDLLESVRERYRTLVNEHPFDFVIGSTHQMVYVDPVYPEFWENRTQREGMEMYFTSGLKNIKNNEFFDTYGHLDYLIRYANGDKAQYNYRDYAELIEPMLRELIARGKALEINSKGLTPSYGTNAPNPGREVLMRYRELGGELITIGSDAHVADGVALYFDRVEELLKEIGFRYYAVFENRKLQMRKFD